MDLSGLSAVSTGYQRGEMNQATIDEARQRVEQQKLATKQQQDDQAALAILGRALGVAPPDQPPLQGPGQPSQPAPQPPPPQQGPPQPMSQGPGPAAPPAGVQGAAALQGGPPPPQGPQQQPPRFAAAPTAVPPPGAVPANPAGQRPMPQQQGAPTPRPAPPPGAGGPAAGGAPPQAAAPGPIVPGQTSLQDLTQRIIRANPGIQSRPDLLVRAIDKGQKLLAPDEKVLFEQRKIQLQFDGKMADIQQKTDAAVQRAASAQQVAEIRAASAQAVADLANERAKSTAAAAGGRAEAKDERARRQKAIDALTKAGGKVDPSATTDELEQQAGDAVKAAGEKKTGAIDRRQLIAAAGKVGVPVKADMSDEEIQNATAFKTAEAAGGAVPEATKKFYGQALLAGDQQLVNSILGMSKNRVGTMTQIIQGAQEIDPSFSGKKAADAAAKYGGEKAAVTQTVKTAGNVALAANEIAQTLPLATAAAKKLDLTQYPTLNALKNASARGGLDKDKQAALGQLDQYQQAMQNAYRLVIGRGGRSTVFDAKQAAELMNSNLPVSVLIAKGQAMLKEAAATKKAAGETIGELTGEEAGPPSDAVKDLKADPSAERQKQFDDVFGAGAAKKALGQ